MSCFAPPISPNLTLSLQELSLGSHASGAYKCRPRTRLNIVRELTFYAKQHFSYSPVQKHETIALSSTLDVHSGTNLGVSESLKSAISRVDRYTIERLIGRGTFSAIALVSSPEDVSKKQALKIVQKEFEISGLREAQFLIHLQMKTLKGSKFCKSPRYAFQ